MSQADYSSAQAYSLLALMNSAPAELLHLLGHAALQPLWLPLNRSKAAAVAKKPPATTPASEYCFKKTKPFFEEKAALPDKIGCSGSNRSDRFSRLLFIKFG
jgi:hypothetical protein